MPPPFIAELPEIVLATIDDCVPELTCAIPPPSTRAVLPSTVQRVSDTLPSERMPPASWFDWLLLIVLSLQVTVFAAMPPPTPAYLLLCRNVAVLPVTRLPFLIVTD